MERPARFAGLDYARRVAHAGANQGRTSGDRPRRGAAVRRRQPPIGAFGFCSLFASPVLQGLITVREVAKQLGVSTTTVYKLCTTRQLPCIRVLGAIRIPPADVAAYIAREGLDNLSQYWHISPR